MITNRGRRPRRSDAVSVVHGGGKNRDHHRAQAGLKLVPDYTFESAPQPKVIVVPAQRGSQGTPRVAPQNVCIDGRHQCLSALARFNSAGLACWPASRPLHITTFSINLRRRFPTLSSNEDCASSKRKKISTAGGLSSGIDLALRVVERYFGRKWPRLRRLTWNIRARVGSFESTDYTDTVTV